MLLTEAHRGPPGHGSPDPGTLAAMIAVAPTTDTTIELPDGRQLLVHEAGDLDGVPVVVHHGTPESGALYAPWADNAELEGIRLISYDRAGYGGSSRAPGRSVASVAGDLAAALDHLGVEGFLTWGMSGGGPHALACAALLPGRVHAVATIAGVAPWDAEDLDAMAGMGEDNVVEFGLALQGEEALRPRLEAFRSDALTSTPAGLAEQMRSLLPPVDLAALAAGAGEHLHVSMLRGLATSVDGWLDDDLAFVRPWGFELADVRVPALVVQGGQDLMVPASHGPWLASRLPDATPWFDAEAGHVSPLLDIGPVHDWLLERWDNWPHPPPKAPLAR